MKVLILGDLHCRSIWKEIVAKEGESCDKIIFLGDYTCPREVKFDDPTDACGFLYDILDFKDRNPDKVVLLRGNHDLCSLGYYWARCWPQDHLKVIQYWQTEDVKNWFLKNTQWIYIIPYTGIVCSHAGISKQWEKNVRKHFNMMGHDYDLDSEVIIDLELINHIEPCELFAFTPCKLSDYSGESATQPCTWIRPYTLLEYGVKDVIHVVGHTPTKHICNIKEECIRTRNELGITEGEEKVEDYCDIWCCDNLQNEEYLIIENGEFKVKKVENSSFLKIRNR